MMHPYLTEWRESQLTAYDWQSTASSEGWLPPEEVEKLREALRNLLNDTQHRAHAGCEAGPCPVREAREVLAAIDAAREKQDG